MSGCLKQVFCLLIHLFFFFFFPPLCFENTLHLPKSGTDYQNRIFLNRSFYNSFQDTADNKWQSLIHFISQIFSNYFNGGFAPEKQLDPNLNIIQQSSPKDRTNVIKAVVGLHTKHIFQLSSVWSNNAVLCFKASSTTTPQKTFPYVTVRAYFSNINSQHLFWGHVYRGCKEVQIKLMHCGSTWNELF